MIKIFYYFTAFLIINPLLFNTVNAFEKQVIAGAGPSTKIVKIFFIRGRNKNTCLIE